MPTKTADPHRPWFTDAVHRRRWKQGQELAIQRHQHSGSSSPARRSPCPRARRHFRSWTSSRTPRSIVESSFSFAEELLVTQEGLRDQARRRRHPVAPKVAKTA